MKTLFKSSTSRIFYALAVSAMLVASGCKEDDPDPDPSEVKFNSIAITGTQEAPEPITTDASGTFDGTYDRDTNIITYTITFTNITPTAMHFHKGAPGVAGGVEIPIPGTTSPIKGSTPALTDAQEADLLAGNWYVNIHSQEHPSGEIRGQLVQ